MNRHMLTGFGSRLTGSPNPQSYRGKVGDQADDRLGSFECASRAVGFYYVGWLSLKD